MTTPRWVRANQLRWSVAGPASRIAVCLALAALGCSAGDRSRPRTAPNVIVIVSDDHGYADLGAHGLNADVRTPHLDDLAAAGVRFTHGYVTAPQCIPSRAALITGRYQGRFGVDANRGGLLPLSERTLAERIRTAGYRTGMVGKWHLDGGQGPAYEPGARGFDEYFDGTSTPFTTNFSADGRTVAGCTEAKADGSYRVDAQTEAALSFLRRRGADRARPFLLYLAYSAPHVPLEKPDAYMRRFQGVEDQTRRQALAALALIDDGVGRIRSLLRALDLEDRTIIFFLSDNGAPTRSEVWNGSLNQPLAGEKGMVVDGGVRVPFLMAWPGVLPSGLVERRAVSSLDIVPTVLAAAGIPAAELDGVDLAPYVKGLVRDSPHAYLFWRWRSQAAVFDGRWKLIRLPPDRYVLFDHATDDHETVDVASRHPDVVEHLLARLEAWAGALSPEGLPSTRSPNDDALYEAHLGLFDRPKGGRGQRISRPVPLQGRPRPD